MPRLADIYTFRASYGGQVRELLPYYDDLLWADEPDSLVSYSRVLNTELTFRGEDYTFLQSMREQEGLCGHVELTIQAASLVVFEGILAVVNGEWSRRDATVTIAPTTRDDSACLEKVLPDKVNILSFHRAPPLRILVGTVSAEKRCDVRYQGEPEIAPPNLCLPDAIGWTLTRRDTTTILGANGYVTDDTARYRREEYSGSAPPGVGWTEYAPGQWARPLYTYISRDFDERDEVDNPAEFITEQHYEILGNDPAKLPDNGVFLSTILSGMLEECSYRIVSNFLNINSDGTAPDNRAYQLSHRYHHIVIFQKTDIKNPDATQNATRAPLSLRELFDFLALLQVYYSVEGDVIRIEHVSYFDRNGMDVAAYLAPFEQDDISYQAKDIPRRETFSWMDESNNPDFEGQSIEYDPLCAQGDEKPIASPLFSPQFSDMSAQPDNYDNKGFVPVATFLHQSNYHIIIDFAIVLPAPVLNQPFTWSVIHDSLYRHERPLPAGEMNGEHVVFESYIPQAKQQEVTIPMSIEEYMSYRPSRKVHTQLGWGRVIKSSYSAINQLLTIQVAHE